MGEAAGFQIHLSNNVPVEYSYTKTTDTALNSAKTYYTLSGGVYTAVASPVVGSIGTYYERSAAPSTYQVIAGTNSAGSFAEQLVELEAYRLEKNFSDAVKGLHVYGAKVVQPKALALLAVQKGA